MSDSPALPSRQVSIGTVTQVENVDGRFGSNDSYNLIVVIHEGEKKHWLLTDAEIQTIEDRSTKNPEDWMGITLPFWQRVLLCLGLL